MLYKTETNLKKITMKRSIFTIVFICIFGSLFASPTWDILNKSMAAWNTNEGTSASQAWAVAQGGSAGSAATQQTGYVNFTKTNAGSTARWAWLRPAAALANVTTGTPYSIEVKVRVNSTGIADNASNFEANQIALRLGSKTTAAPIYLRYGDGVTNGSISTTSNGSNAYKLNTSAWQVYRLVFQANHTKYDVYVAGIDEPIFENIAVGTTTDQNGIYFGAESPHRCNMDIEYVKMGTGDFFSMPKISTVDLSRDSHASGTESTVAVTARTAAIANGNKLLVSFVDRNDNVIVAPIEATVTDNVATANIVIPATVADGQYAVKVTANGQINGMDVAPKSVTYEILDPILAQTWNILNRNFSVKAWDMSPVWALEKGGSVAANFVTQQNGYVNVYKTQAYGSGYYAFLNSPEVALLPNTAYTCEVKARVKAIDKNEFPDVIKPTPSEAGGFESNHIAFRLNNKYMSIHLIYGDENTGYIAPHVVDGTGISPSQTIKHALNTSEWHTYRMIFNADNTKYNIYVDGQLVFEDVLVAGKSGSNMAKIGGESWQRCNMDIEYVRMATGDLVSGNKPRIASVALSSDSHIANNSRTIQVTANTSLISDGEKLQVSLVNKNNVDQIAPVEITVNSNKATTNLTIPATVPLGDYAIKVGVAGGKIGDQAIDPKSMQYVVVGASPIDTKILPQVKTVGFVKEMADYKYVAPSKEFIFPSVIDTRKYTVDGKFKNGQAPIDRYYLYYAPHENPGGIFLSTAPSLDGPWTEYSGSTGMTPGTVMDFAWASAQSNIIKNGAERHISACQVVWNEVQNKFVMYFHGPNTTTHYATSDNLVDWTFGASILVSTQFSPISAEASYAKAFEHEIPGLGNKYVILLMNQENQVRKIYWAHSKDGINWTPVTKPLISPDLEYKKVPGTDRKPSYDGGGTGAYGNNISGPYLMERDGRYFVICHGSSDNLLVVEVGKGFDMEVHWGEYILKSDVILNIDGVPTATRPAAPDFHQDDNGRWYMFFEAGSRLGANIAYAKEDDSSTGVHPSAGSDASVAIYPTTVARGQHITVETRNALNLSAEIIDLYGKRISTTKIKDFSGQVCTPVVPGLYFVKVTSNGNLLRTIKLVVK